jgi:hypothetical protein
MMPDDTRPRGALDETPETPDRETGIEPAMSSLGNRSTIIYSMT